ncbi:MAG: hypothetical protein K5776_05525 [Lachnospiraceae bacterium]|nr:hypothetical protein [Lachnospiraceae bacterium]
MKTKKIFDTDAFIKENKTTVTKCALSEREGFEKLYEAVTDSTIFSPEGGGQKSDEGFFDDVRVVDVQEFDGEIIHFLESEIPAGTEVLQKIDLDLRFRRMQNHNAEHLICGLIHKKFGYSNVGFHLSETSDENRNVIRIEAVMDVDGPIDAKDLEEIELQANMAIASNVPVYALLPSAEEAKDIAYRSKLDIEENLRLVVIEGYDICACCAPCLKSSAEMQLVKIIDSMPHRGGMRLTLIAGIDAVKDYIDIHKDNKKIMNILSSKRNECANAVENLYEKSMQLHEENSALKKEITDLNTKEVIKKITENNLKFYVFYAPDFDEIQSRKLINEVALKTKTVMAVMFEKKNSTYRFVVGKNADVTDISLRELAKNMQNKLSSRGGGSEQMIQGSIPANDDLINSFFEEMNK